MRRPRLVLALLVALGLLTPAAAQADRATAPWPPMTGPGQLFVHYGEEHYNDADGGTILPKIVASSAAYEPELVTMSGDKGNDGELDQLQAWKQIMGAYDKAGIPYLAGVGNHDRNSPPGVPGGTIGLVGGTTPDSIDNYRATFADRPFPMGDAPNYPGIGPARPADDMSGAPTHYYADVGAVRWIFLDNSCYSLTTCDPFQLTAGGAGAGAAQLDYLRATAGEASAAGRMAFVVMHMPTQDPRDQDQTDATARNHVMGKGASPDNATFERVAQESGVDGVFLGHIKGQFTYQGAGGVPYFIDGGAGGELYTTGAVGADHGYWHGYRLIRVADGKITQDTVPVFKDGGITVAGADKVAVGEPSQFVATGEQPVFNDPAKVPALELRDPDPRAPAAGSRKSGLAAIPVGLDYLAPVLVCGFLLLVMASSPSRRRKLIPAGLVGGAGAVALTAAVATAQQEIPTKTPKSALPIPARIWTTDDARVMAPIASADDDPRRDAATQTDGGRFTARCPGTTTVRVTSGWETTPHKVIVPSRAGTLVKAINRGSRSVRRGKAIRVAGVRLAQPAIVKATVTNARGKRVATLVDTCSPGTRSVRWDAKGVARGRYTVTVTVPSDRARVVKRFGIRVR